MPKVAPDSTIDAMLAEIATADTMYACSDAPADFAGIAAVALADVAMTPGDGNDYAIADGDTSGRKVTMAEKPNVDIDDDGTATHVVLADSSNSKLVYVTTCGSQALATGNTVSFPSWKVEVADPT